MDNAVAPGANGAPGTGAAGDVLVLKVAYDGTEFSGFAAQERQTHVRTVAGELARALGTLLRREVDLTCAGRTDAGVHARAQHVSVPMTPEESASLSGERLLRSLGAVLPGDVRVGAVYRADAGFSARFDARARRYRYRIVAGPVGALFNARWSWWLRCRSASDLDVAAMDEAARCLVGEHDFKSFCKATSAEGKPTHRCVMRCDVSEEWECGERVVCIDVVGNAFLHSMVRTMAGTLVEVGRGHRGAAWVADALAACDRKAAGPCAPAKGLTFVGVDYPQELLVPWE